MKKILLGILISVFLMCGPCFAQSFGGGAFNDPSAPVTGDVTVQGSVSVTDGTYTGEFSVNAGNASARMLSSNSLELSWLSGEYLYFSDDNGAPDAAFFMSRDTDQFGFSVNDDWGNQFIFTNYNNRAKDHDHALQTNPTRFTHSDLNPDVSNNQWGSLAHDQENIVLKTGANVGTGSAPTTDNNGVLISPSEMTSSGTADFAMKIERTLNDTNAAGGSDLFNALLIDITSTDVTGWDTVNLIDVKDDANSRFRIDQAGDMYVDGGSTFTMTADAAINFTSSANGDIQISPDGTGTIAAIGAGVTLAFVTGDPCGAADFPEGSIFWNDTSDEACYCDASGVDLRLKDASTACF